jgi:hypothetical protein
LECGPAYGSPANIYEFQFPLIKGPHLIGVIETFSLYFCHFNHLLGVFVRLFPFVKRCLLEIRLSSKIQFEQSQFQEIYWRRRQCLFYPLVEGKLIRGFEGLDVGDRVRVEGSGVDVERGFIDFAQAGRACLPVGRGRGNEIRPSRQGVGEGGLFKFFLNDT